MKIVFVTHTPLAGMPWRTARVVDRALRASGDGWMRCVVVSPGAYGTRTYPTDLALEDPGAKDALDECELVIVPAYMQWPGPQPSARHLSTEPFRWVTQDPDANGHTVVAQYQWRFAKHLTPLPNCIPVDDPMFSPQEKPDRIVIVYSPTSRSGTLGDWANKGFEATTTALRRIERDYRDRVSVLLLQGVPYERVMAARRRAHIVIDECATGSYHSTTLEGLSCGAATIVRIDDLTQEAIDRMYGQRTILPVLNTQLVEIEDRLRTLVENKETTLEIGRQSRAWMLRNYSEEWQAEQWIRWHRSFLLRRRPSLTA